jgi:hypothetical protein
VALARDHERAAGPRRDWPRLRDLVSIGAEKGKAILGTPLGGENPSDFSRSVDALGMLAYAPAEALLIDVLEHCPTYKPRQAAIKALVALGSETARTAVFERFDEALDGMVGRIAISEVLCSQKGLAMLPGWIGPHVDKGLRARNVENLGEAIAWMLQFRAASPHADVAAAVSRLLPEPDTREWFERKLAEFPIAP